MKGNIMKITKLKVNRIVNPIGFDLGKPRISYVVVNTESKKQSFAITEAIRQQVPDL